MKIAALRALAGCGRAAGGLVGAAAQLDADVLLGGEGHVGPGGVGAGVGQGTPVVFLAERAVADDALHGEAVE